MTESSPAAAAETTPQDAQQNAATAGGARAGKREWKDLSPLAKVAVVVGATIQLGLLVAALVDLFRRRPDQINGPRALWVAVSSVNFVGPIAYFLFGRRRS